MSVDKKRVGFANNESSNENASSDGKESEGFLNRARGRNDSSSDQGDDFPLGGNSRGKKLSGSVQQQSKRQGIDYASLIKSSGGAGSRMTLRDLELSLPVENSDLDSDEDPDQYFAWLQEEDVRIKET